MSDNYYEFKIFFLSDTTHESQMPSLPLQISNVSHISTPNLSDDSQPAYSDSGSDSDSEVFEYFETTYQLIGVIKNKSTWDEQNAWIVNITDPDQISKIGKPGLVSISGLFKYENDNSFPIDSHVQVEITYNNKGGCIWNRNKIISLLK
jgi:hypothetical protein